MNSNSRLSTRVIYAGRNQPRLMCVTVPYFYWRIIEQAYDVHNSQQSRSVDDKLDPEVKAKKAHKTTDNESAKGGNNRSPFIKWTTDRC